MLTPQQIQHFQQHGYVNGGPVLDDSAVDVLRAELQRVIDDHGREDIAQPVHIVNLSHDKEHPIWQIVNIWEASSAFRGLIHNTTITEMTAQLTGAQELRVWHDQVQYKPKEYGGNLHWHQDSPLWRTLAPKTAQISAWVALDDVDESNGCMHMVPGSHQWGNNIDFIHGFGGENLPDEYEGHKLSSIACPVQKGHVHFHHSLTWHGSGANTSDRPRRAIAIHYMTDETVFDATGEHVMKKFIEVDDGDQLAGEHFPLVWRAGE